VRLECLRSMSDIVGVGRERELAGFTGMRSAMDTLGFDRTTRPARLGDAGSWGTGGVDAVDGLASEFVDAGEVRLVRGGE
jgi:hypothetical protein